VANTATLILVFRERLKQAQRFERFNSLVLQLHFIFRHKNPNTGDYEEKHAKTPSGKFDHIFDDKKPHVLRLVVQPDNNFEIFLDGSSISTGNLLSDVQPPINPPAEIDDPHDSKPETWDEREKIPDPDAEKPEDWDEDAPATIPDPNAKVRVKRGFFTMICVDNSLRQ
jgi:hypothetical protein